MSGMTKRRTLTLTDPRAMRVLAHEVRQQLLEELGGGEVLTATEAAQRCGITPSAMSYHLRAMERWGIVERVDSEDGRERPWRLAADSIRIDAEGQAKMPANVENSLLGAFARSVSRDLGELDADAHVTASLVNGIYLTDDEAAELDATVKAALARFDDRHNKRTAPKGTVRRDIYWLSLPRE